MAVSWTFYIHHAFNLTLVVSFLAAKFTPLVCRTVFARQPEPCELSDNECKLLFFGAFVVWAKTKKSGARSMLPYISTVYTYLKLLNLVLWFYSGVVAGVVYLVLALAALLWFPEPAIMTVGEDRVTYFSSTELETTLSHSRNTTFLVCFFATWLPSSVQFAKVFSSLSASYSLDNLVFGKVDVTRHPEAADTHHISSSAFTRQLPTVVLFDNGVEVTRRPGIDAKKRLVPFLFTKENVVSAFDLNNIYRKAKEELPRFRKLELKKQK